MSNNDILRGGAFTCACTYKHIIIACAQPESSGDDEDEFLSDEQKQHKKEFREWRKKHYNEFLAVKEQGSS